MTSKNQKINGCNMPDVKPKINGCEEILKPKGSLKINELLEVTIGGAIIGKLESLIVIKDGKKTKINIIP